MGGDGASTLVLTVSRLSGDVVFGPAEVSQALTFRQLRGFFDPGDGAGKDRLLTDGGVEINDEDSLAVLGGDAFLMLVDNPLPEVEEQLEAAAVARAVQPQRLCSWEVKLREVLSPGHHFGTRGQNYSINEKIGSGGQAYVYRCTRCPARNDVHDAQCDEHCSPSSADDANSLGVGSVFAVKAFNLWKAAPSTGITSPLPPDVEQLQREVALLRDLQHDCIVRIIDDHHTQDHFFLVMELVPGGELLQHVKDKDGLVEAEAWYIFWQLLSAVSYMHSMHVIHRDLKLENILVARSTLGRSLARGRAEELLSVKLIDFGLSKKVAVTRQAPIVTVDDSALLLQPPSLLRATTAVGTPAYCAPEVTSQARHDAGEAYDERVDYFSIGVCLYTMLTCSLPSVVWSASRRGHTSFNHTDEWKELSPEVQDLIKGLLDEVASARSGLQQCLHHAWVTVGGPPLSLPLAALPTRDAPGLRPCERDVPCWVVKPLS